MLSGGQRQPWRKGDVAEDGEDWGAQYSHPGALGALAMAQQLQIAAGDHGSSTLDETDHGVAQG